MAHRVKRLPTMQETRVQSLGREDLEKEMATHSSILAWKMEEPGRLQSMAGYGPWGCKKSDTTEQLHFHFQLRLQDQGLNLCMQVLELLK